MKTQCHNPYLPLWEHIPDGEPHVFEDRYMYSEVMIWRMGMNFVSRIMYHGRHRWMTCLTGVMKA